MNIYISSIAAISPQETLQKSNLMESLMPLDTDIFRAKHPNYKEYLNPRSLRRMSGVVRMGVTAANIILEEQDIETPDAIVIGTSLGCITDTEKFLNQIDRDRETLLNPTSFIQSTHNTVSGQIAMLTKCNSHNLTFSHGRLSFEHALLETSMLLQEESYNNIILGAIDEVTSNSANLIKRSNCSKNRSISVGEGATFMILSDRSDSNHIAKIVDLKIIKSSNRLKSERESIIDNFLKDNSLSHSDIDIVISGSSSKFEELFKDSINIGYRDLAGEYDTDIAFGLFIATEVIRQQRTPNYIELPINPGSIDRLLLINEIDGAIYSLTILER